MMTRSTSYHPNCRILVRDPSLARYGKGLVGESNARNGRGLDLGPSPARLRALTRVRLHFPRLRRPSLPGLPFLWTWPIWITQPSLGW